MIKLHGSRRKGSRGLAFKLAVLVLTGVIAVFSAIYTYDFLITRQIVMRTVEQSARNLAQATINKIEDVLNSVEKVVENTAALLEETPWTKDDLHKIVRRVLARNTDIYGMGVEFEPYAVDPKRLYFAPYFYRVGDRLEYMEIGSPTYHYFNMDWFQVPKEMGTPVWTEPYFDEGGGGVLMTTYAFPIYRVHGAARRFLGTVSGDISLAWLQSFVNSVKVYETGYAFLLSRNGAFVTHPKRELVMNETIFTFAEQYDDKQLREVGKEMIAGRTGFVEIVSHVTGKDSFLYYAPVPSTGGSVGVVFPKEELFAEVNRMGRTSLFLGLAGLAALCLVVVVIARSIARPVRELSDAAMEIAAGNLDLELPEVRSRDEIRDLADSFFVMRRSLKEYIKNLTATTASKERIESELRIARDIQMGILPKIFPPFPHRTEFDIYAMIQPAREVGGDLYDFFFVDDNTFCFVVGDVSDKGVPAALFMAVTKTLLKVVAERGLTPGEILSKVNDDLCEENESCMFVTLFCAMLDTRTGLVRYASAGHNPPVLVPGEGLPRFIPTERQPVAGAMPGVTYGTDTLTLLPGEVLLLYTDGVTEAMTAVKEMYSEERLIEHLRAAGDSSARALIESISASIVDFTGGADQSDDITMLALRFLRCAAPEDGDGEPKPEPKE